MKSELEEEEIRLIADGNGLKLNYEDPITKDICDESSDAITDKNYSTKWDKLLSETHEKHLTTVGTGPYHWILILITGISFGGECVEFLSLSFVFPNIQLDLCIDSFQKGLLAAGTTVGMVIGGFSGGQLCDTKGRRYTMLVASSFGTICGITASLAPTYWSLVVFRVLSGISFGALSVSVHTMQAENVSQKYRSHYMGYLLLFYSCASGLLSILALLVLNNEDYRLHSETNIYHFASWRLFLMLSVFPSAVAFFSTFFLKESPRFLLHKGRLDEAREAYLAMFRWNHKNKVFPVFNLPERSEILNEKYKMKKWKMITNNLKELFSARFYKSTLLVSLCWIGWGVGYYGLTVWFVEYYTLLDLKDYSTQKLVIANTTYFRKAFISEIKNTKYENCQFDDVTFHATYLNDVVFSRAKFVNSSFTDIISPNTVFVDSTITNCTFDKTDMYPTKFHNVSIKDTRFVNYLDVCQEVMEVYDEKKIMTYNLIGQSLAIPAVILFIATNHKTRRIRSTAASFFLSAVSVASLILTDGIIETVAIQTIFIGINMVAACNVDTVSMEQFPTYLRSTAYGTAATCGRGAGALINLLFARYIQTSKIIPLLVTSGVTVLSGLLILLLPESKDWFM